MPGGVFISSEPHYMRFSRFGNKEGNRMEKLETLNELLTYMEANGSLCLSPVINHISHVFAVAFHDVLLITMCVSPSSPAGLLAMTPSVEEVC